MGYFFEKFLSLAVQPQRFYLVLFCFDSSGGFEVCFLCMEAVQFGFMSHSLSDLNFENRKQHENKTDIHEECRESTDQMFFSTLRKRNEITSFNFHCVCIKSRQLTKNMGLINAWTEIGAPMTIAHHSC